MYRQPSLFGTDEVGVDAAFNSLDRRWLDAASYVDYCPTWLSGADGVFEQLLNGVTWLTRQVPMYDRIVDEPRLHSWWRASGATPEPLLVLAEARAVLSEHYGVAFDTIGLNYYRDQHDSVAWHRDRHQRSVRNPIVAIVSVGDRRPFRLRPHGGGASIVYQLGHGDLLVMGGACQHGWEHTITKLTTGVGPRISITYRHGTVDDAAGEGAGAPDYELPAQNPVLGSERRDPGRLLPGLGSGH